MASMDSPALGQKRPRSRKSIAHPPSAMDKENMTTDLSSLRSKTFDFAHGFKRARSRSIGPADVARLMNENPAIRNLRNPIQVRSILKPTLPVSPLREISALQSRHNSPLATRQPTTPSKRTPSKASPSKANAELKAAEEEAAKEKENQERREAERKEILARREARRKSMANRRVSFAPEATLHEWNPDKYDDSTSSSASTSSSRRASAVFEPEEELDDDPPSTPQKEDSSEPESPAPQRDLHKKKRRRSSTIPPMNFNNPEDEEFSSSPMSIVSDAHDENEVFDSPAGSSHSSDSDEESISGDGTTMMSIDDGDTTSHSVRPGNVPAPAPAEVTESLEEEAEQTMELAGDEVTTAFRAFSQQVGAPLETIEEMDDTGDLSMDVTRAIGGILPSATDARRASIRAVIKDDRLSESSGDMTMDLTVPIGSIQAQEDDNDEEMTMEFTTAIGGLLSKPQVDESEDTDEDDQTMDMDMTRAIGGIISQVVDAEPSFIHETPIKSTRLSLTQAKEFLKAEADHGDLGTPQNIKISDLTPKAKSPAKTPAKSPARTPAKSPAKSPARTLTKSPARRLSMNHVATSETGSPSIVDSARRRSLRNSGLQLSSTPVSTTKRASATSTPLKSPATPTKQITPQASRPITPSKPVVPKSISFRSASPKKLFKEDKSGKLTPRVSIPPPRRRSSGIGIDREGLGSPQMAAKLDRRRSIGDTAPLFTLNMAGSPKRTVAFEKPQDLEVEMQIEEEEQAQEQVTEKAEQDATLNLKEMIESMTPKKPLRGRKSLAVGGGKALLGKRTFEEASSDSEDEIRKRPRGEASPVKAVVLPKPPSKEELSGKLKTRQSLSETTGNATPQRQIPTKDDVFESVPQLEEQEAASPAQPQIRLSEFLDMTSIRFMELTTTKRRQTVGPSAILHGENLKAAEVDDNSPASLVMTGVSTVPQLELFQHSCRELKRYIAEGRGVVKEIETDTFEENPPLFREYMNAPQDVRFIMDNQFKNVKTNARLHSKAMWYEWRMKLLDGLQDGLQTIKTGLGRDGAVVDAQIEIIGNSVETLKAENLQLATEEQTLRQHAEELANDNQEELSLSRARLATVEEQIAAKSALLAAKQAQFKESSEKIEAMQARKKQCQEEIAESEKIREACRGWTASEVRVHQEAAKKLESIHGWMITGASGTHLSLTFRQSLELELDSNCFQTQSGPAKSSTSGKLSARYVAKAKHVDTSAQGEIAFFLESLNKNLSSVTQADTMLKDLLAMVGSFWATAEAMMEERRLLNTHFYTTSSQTDDHLVLRSTVLLHQLNTKAYATVQVSVSPNGKIMVKPEMSIAYGERFNETKMKQFLQTKINPVMSGEQSEASGSWRDALIELSERLIVQRRK